MPWPRQPPGSSRRVTPESLINALERFPDLLRAAVSKLAPEDARWRPPDGAWSILEIVSHVADEEVEDFRRRLEITLADPAAEWPPIDPRAITMFVSIRFGS